MCEAFSALNSRNGHGRRDEAMVKMSLQDAKLIIFLGSTEGVPLSRLPFPLNYKLSAECIDIIPSKGYDSEVLGSNSGRKF